MILQALGDPASNIRPDFYEADIKNIILLLSTDGLHDNLDKEIIGEIVSSHQDDLATAVDLLIDRALECGSEDNVTAVVVKDTSKNNHAEDRIF
jgi:serine/threonine protein phosphatase PrpC